MGWTLILHDNDDMLGYLAGAVGAVLTADRCRLARNVQDAQALAFSEGMSQCRLIVASLTARASASAVPDVDRRELSGLDFVRQLRGLGVTTPALLVCSFIDTERVSEATGVEGVQLIGAQDLAGNLAERVRALSGPASAPGVAAGPAAPARYRVDLDIVLRHRQQSCWSMRGAGGIAVEDSGKLDIDDTELDDLRGRSDLRSSPSSMAMQSLGLSIYKLLMADNLKSEDLEIKLNNSVHSYGGLSIARIRFNVDERTHPIHLETLAKPDKLSETPDFWMLRAPMFRKYGDRGERPPLFKDRRSQVEPVDCLLILGCDEAFAAGAPLLREFHALPAARRESAWLGDWLASRGQEVGRITVLRHADYAEGAFAQAVRQELAAHPYALVHYCGHSDIGDDETAYLAFGGADSDLVTAEDFAGWTSSVQFMFLSSCHSAKASFIMKLVRAKVPAVAGYAWPMEDAVAACFTEAFYTCLFSEGRDHRYLEYSFMQAKRLLHRRYRSQGHWVAPQLFMQMLDHQAAAA
jgi:hypothetical protein